MLRRTLPLLACLALAAVTPARGSPPEVSLGYSGLLAGDEYANGWQASCAVSSWSSRSALVLDAGGYYASGGAPHTLPGGAAHTLLAGPRVSTRVGQRAALFAEVLAGLLFVRGGPYFVAHPGAGIDVALGRDLALRAEVDWPIIQGGLEFSLARVSVGIVLHPALVKP